MVHLKTFVVAHLAGLSVAIVVLTPSIVLFSAFNSGKTFEPIRLHVVDALHIPLLLFKKTNVLQKISHLPRPWVNFRINLVELSLIGLQFSCCLSINAEPCFWVSQELIGEPLLI